MNRYGADALKEMINEIYKCIKFEAYTYSDTTKQIRPRLEFKKAYALLEKTADDKSLMKLRLLLAGAIGTAWELRTENESNQAYDYPTLFCRHCANLTQDQQCVKKRRKPYMCFDWKYSSEVDKIKCGCDNIVPPQIIPFELPTSK